MSNRFFIDLNTEDNSKEEIEEALRHSLRILDLKIDERKPINKSIVTYIHLVDINESYKNTALDIINPIINSGLIEESHIKFLLHYNRESFTWLEEMFLGYDNVEFFYPDVSLSDYEIPSINKIREDCLNFDSEHFILYLHHKGVTRPNNGPATDWRKFLVHFNVDRWRDNVALLEYGFDTVGVNLLENPLHYSGNFWWSKSSYIKTLPEIPRFVNRHYAENWICSNNPRACEVFNSGVDHYKYEDDYPEYLYKVNGEVVPPVSGFEVVRQVEKNNYSGDLIGIEIGCSSGVSSEYILDQIPNCTLHSVDPYENYTDWNKDVLDDKVNESNYRRALQRTSRFEDRFVLHKAYSDDEVHYFDDNSIDFIFIDGMHTYQQVLSDCENYYPKVKDGGLFCGHDYRTITEVKKAVDEFSSRVGATVELGANDTWYWVK